MRRFSAPCKRFVKVSCATLALTLALPPPLHPPASAQSRPAFNLPSLGDDASDVLSPAMERKIGEQYYRQLRRERSFMDDPELVEYVTGLGARLVAAIPPGAVESRPDIEYFLLQDASINAFAMIGGYIGVNSGLILTAETEAEAASVIAHEIGHLTQRHLARGISRAQRNSSLSLAALALAVLLARSSSGASEALMAGSEAAQVQAQLADSREFEREADRIGMQTLIAAGFDASAAVSFFQRLQRATTVYDTNAPVYLRSHPMTSERIADLQARVRDARYRQREDSIDFHYARAKLRALSDTTAQGLRDSVTLFQQLIKERANDPRLVSALRFGLAHAHLLQRDLPAARAAVGAIGERSSHAMLDHLRARLLIAEGNAKAATTLLEQSTKRFPESRALGYALLEAKQGQGAHAEVANILRDKLTLYRQDPRLYELHAKSLGALGRRTAAHRALAEAYALTGALPAAIEQLQIARRAGDGDFYELSIVDARLCELQAQSVREAEESRGGFAGGRGPVRAERRGCG